MKADLHRRPAAPEETTGLRGDLLGALLAVALVGAAALVPLIAGPTLQEKIFADAPPLFGRWLAHVGWGTVPAIALAAAVVLWGPTLARHLSWRSVLALSWGGTLVWMVSLALVDGWQRGITDRLTDKNEYLHEVPGITDIPAMLRGFADRILDFQPDSWTTHVSGHPPGAVLTFVTLDRFGLSGGGWAAALCVVVGSSAVVAVLVTVRALAGEEAARAAAPFLVLAPLAIWVAVSADGYFLGVTAWGIALLALSTQAAGTRATLLAVGAGLLLGFGVYLNYGLVLMGVPAVAVLLAARTWRPLLPALIGALAVAAAFTLSGFWWFEGMDLVVDRYYQGIASDRPFAYWGWANFAATACAVGLATAAGLHRALAPARLRGREGVGLLVAAGLLAIALADVSALSKAETERIWLSFTIWIVLAASLLPRQHHRAWLLAQAILALLINHLILTNW